MYNLLHIAWLIDCFPCFKFSFSSLHTKPSSIFCGSLRRCPWRYIGWEQRHCSCCDLKIWGEWKLSQESVKQKSRVITCTSALTWTNSFYCSIKRKYWAQNANEMVPIISQCVLQLFLSDWSGWYKSRVREDERYPSQTGDRGSLERRPGKIAAANSRRLRNHFFPTNLIIEKHLDTKFEHFYLKDVFNYRVNVFKLEIEC